MSFEMEKLMTDDAPLSQDLPTPLYHQIQLVLRERVEHGYYGRDGLLPSEQEISREFGVSRITVARAVNELAAQGLVERRRGAGTRVKPRSLPPPVAADIDGLLENLLEMGLKTQVALLEFGFVLPTEDVQRELQVGQNELVQRAVRVRSHEGAPFSYLTSFIPGHLGRHFGAEDLGTRPLLSLLEENGVKVASARQSFGAVLADPKVAAALGIAVGAPLLSIVRTVLDRDQQPVEYIRILYRPDRYQYRMTLERERKGKGHVWASGSKRSGNGRIRGEQDQ